MHSFQTNRDWQNHALDMPLFRPKSNIVTNPKRCDLQRATLEYKQILKTMQGFSSSILKGGFVSRLRKLIVRLFWIVPLVYGMAAVAIPSSLFRMIQDTSSYAYQVGELRPWQIAMLWRVRLLLFLLAISPVAITVTSALAAVQFFRAKRSGRNWAIACGVSFLATSFPILCTAAFLALIPRRMIIGSWLGLPVFGLTQAAAGILILVAFLPREAADQIVLQNTRPAPVKGDGTTSLSLYVGIAVVAGGYYLGDSLCRRWALHANLPHDLGFVHTNLILLGALILAVACHELGHMVAGQVVGMKLLSFRIGPLQGEL